MCANLWTGLISTKGLKKTSNREKEKLRLSLRRGGISGHRPFLILPEGFIVKPQRPWRFENLWLKNEGCHDIMAGAWRIVPLGLPMAQVMGKIENY